MIRPGVSKDICAQPSGFDEGFGGLAGNPGGQLGLDGSR